MNWVKDWYAHKTNPDKEHGTVHDVMNGADVFFGLSAPGVIDENDLSHMSKDPVIFAMANPTPEIMPEVGAGRVAVMATGRSDYPNQINNVLCFPGIFRGALNCRASRINEAMKLAAANAIADIIGPDELHPDYVIPSVVDRRVGEAVAERVEEAAYESGVARRSRSTPDTEFSVEYFRRCSHAHTTTRPRSASRLCRPRPLFRTVKRSLRATPRFPCSPPNLLLTRAGAGNKSPPNSLAAAA